MKKIKVWLAVAVLLSPGMIFAQSQGQSRTKKRKPVNVPIPTVPDLSTPIGSAQSADASQSDPLPAVDKTVTDAQGQTWNIRFQIQSVQAAQFDALANNIAPVLGFYSKTFGPLSNRNVTLVENVDPLNPPDDKAGTLVFRKDELTPEALHGGLNSKLAQLWWGQKVTAGSSDEWITEGMSHYAPYLYVESQGNKDATKLAIWDLQVSAKTFDSTQIGKRLSDMNTLEKSRVYYRGAADKAAVVFDALRRQIGDDAFFKTIKVLAANPGGDFVTTERVIKLAETASGQKNLNRDVEDWVESVSKPADFVVTGTIYRKLKDNTYVSDLTIKQTDEFGGKTRVPLKIETDSGLITPAPKIEIKGPETRFVLPTRERPSSIQIGESDGITEADSKEQDFEAAIHIAEDNLRSYHEQQSLNKEDENDFNAALISLNAANRKRAGSSILYFDIGQTYFIQNPPDTRTAYGFFRTATEADGTPSWTVAWSYLYMGEILDSRNQKEEAAQAYNKVIALEADAEATAKAQQYLANLPHSQDEIDPTTHQPYRYHREEAPMPIIGRPIAAPSTHAAGTAADNPMAAPVIKATQTGKK